MKSKNLANKLNSNMNHAFHLTFRFKLCSPMECAIWDKIEESLSYKLSENLGRVIKKPLFDPYVRLVITNPRHHVILSTPMG